MSSISRDAEIFAYCIFLTGYPWKVTYRRPEKIDPRTRAAVEELVAAGYAVAVPADDLPKGAVGWQATKELGKPISRFAPPEDSESWTFLLE